MVPLKRKLSCVTMPMFPRSTARQIAQRVAIDRNLAGVEFVKASEQIHEGGFARAGRTDQRDRVSRTRVERDVV